MRTTLAIRDDLYEAARRRAFDERRTLGDVVNELIERGLTDSAASRPRTLGTFAGQIDVTEDFDDEVPDVEIALDESIDR